MTINFATLFTRLGHAFKCGNDIETAGATTVPASRDAFIAGVAALDATDEINVTSGLNGSLDSYKSAGGSAIQGLVVAPSQSLLKVTVHNDKPLLSETTPNLIAELRAQMLNAGESLDANEPSITTSYGSGGSSSGPEGDNTGDGILVFSTKRGDGLVNEFILPETIDAAISSVSSSGAAVWALSGETAITETAVTWPGGSGLSASVTSHTASSSSNLLATTTGTFETADATATSLPYGWIVSVGTAGTQFALTAIEQQSVVINGTPTGGYYVLKFTDQAGRTYTTSPIAYNASGSTVATALQALPGLGSISISTTGTSPNYSHTITMTGVTNPTQLAYTSVLTGGSPTITITTPTPGSANVARGARSLYIIGDAATTATLTTIQAPVSVAAGTQYAVNFWGLADVVPAAGVLVLDLVDGIGGTVVNDDQGNANTLTVNLTTETTSFTSHPVVFRTPSVLPATTYLRLRLTTALSTGSNYFVDELCMVAMTELYAGGPFVAAFSGPTDFVVGDEATITVANDMRGALHTWCNRVFALRTNRLLLPTVTDNSETQADTLIA